MKQLSNLYRVDKPIPPFLQRVNTIAAEDVIGLRKAEESYGDSWKRRGGVGAFMMLARKWDRLEKQVKENGYDVFAAIEKDERSEGIIDDLRDLRRYLMLVEGEMRARGSVAAESTHRDNAVDDKETNPAMTFDTLRAANIKRNEQVFRPLKEWSPADWACAVAGEAGEVCNAVQKIRRLKDGTNATKDPSGEEECIKAVAGELADMIIFGDLLAARLGIDLGRAVERKFNEVSDRMKSDIRIW